jgi:elongation factor P
MSTTHDLRRGMVIRHAGQLLALQDFTVAQSGKQRPTVHLKLRNIKTGNPVDRTLDDIGKIEEVPTEIRNMQYLYAAGKDRVFMDAESFEQYNLHEDVLGKDAAYLVESDTYRVLTIEGHPVALQLPPVIALAVADTAPGEHGGGSSVLKEAKLASGLVVHVPLFIKPGDKIRIKTDTREYQGKEH